MHTHLHNTHTHTAHILVYTRMYTIISHAPPYTAGDTAGIVGDNVDNEYIQVKHKSMFVILTNTQ